MLSAFRTPTLLTAAIVGLSCLACPSARAQSPSLAAPAPPSPLARTVAEVIAAAIPPAYEKKKDWGATKDIAVGLRTEGKGLHTKLHRRKRAVKHGVWKHYQVHLVDPAESLRVNVVRLEPAGPGRMAFELQIDAKIDAWGRAKVYQYGVHLIALEVLADARVHLDVAGEIALRLDAVAEAPGVVIEPVVTRAAIRFDEFAIRRISNAHGPLVHELGDGVRRLLEDAYDEPTLVAKLNRSIEKKQDRLRVQWSSFAINDWLAVSKLAGDAR